MARHTVDQGLLDSVYQGAVTGNGTTPWNGEQGGAFNIYPGYPVHLASNGGIPHGYVWNQSRFQADSSACPTHVRQPVPTATEGMPSQPYAWDNTLGPAGLIQTSGHGMYTAKCTDLFAHVYKMSVGIPLADFGNNNCSAWQSSAQKHDIVTTAKCAKGYHFMQTNLPKCLNSEIF